MRFHRLFFLPLLLLTACGSYQPAENIDPDAPSGIELSQELLRQMKAGADAGATVDQIATLDPNQLAAELDSRNEKLAFWVNIYNGMVQYLLTENSSLYDNRSNFFSTPSFTVAGKELSPNELEHGIIRGGENRFGLGFLPQFFPNKFERTFKVKGGDSRIHFALNCGAADCPPVAIYDPETYDEQINARVRSYLAKHSEIRGEGDDKTLVTSPLFSWFKGDFRDHDGVDDFLVEYGVLKEENKDIDRDYKDYDWTLETGIWAK